MGETINADISHPCWMWILTQMAGHARLWVGLQGSGVCERGLLEATLPWGFFSHPVPTGSGGSLVRAHELPSASSQARGKVRPAYSSLKLSTISVSPSKRLSATGSMEG